MLSTKSSEGLVILDGVANALCLCGITTNDHKRNVRTVCEYRTILREAAIFSVTSRNMRSADVSGVNIQCSEFQYNEIRTRREVTSDSSTELCHHN